MQRLVFKNDQRNDFRFKSERTSLIIQKFVKENDRFVLEGFQKYPDCPGVGSSEYCEACFWTQNWIVQPFFEKRTYDNKREKIDSSNSKQLTIDLMSRIPILFETECLDQLKL